MVEPIAPPPSSWTTESTQQNHESLFSPLTHPHFQLFLVTDRGCHVKITLQILHSGCNVALRSLSPFCITVFPQTLDSIKEFTRCTSLLCWDFYIIHSRHRQNECYVAISTDCFDILHVLLDILWAI